MFKNVLIAAVIVFVSPVVVFSQELFWSFDSTSLQSTSTQGPGASGTAYLFSEGIGALLGLDLDFSSSDSNVLLLTGGVGFNPTLNTLGGTRFDSSVITIDPAGDSGNFFAVNFTQNGLNPTVGPLFDPGFQPNVGPNGAFLLAQVDYQTVNEGTATLYFSVGDQGFQSVLGISINPSFQPATLTVVSAPTLLGDVNLDGTVDFLDITPFVTILSSATFQDEADLDQNGEVNFLDLITFVGILRSI